jgi:predicted esterase
MKQYSTIEEEQEVGLRFAFRPGARSNSPVVLLIHGRAGNRDVMWAFQRTIPADSAIVSFEAFNADRIGGYSWWDVSQLGNVHQGILLAGERLAAAWERFREKKQLSPSKVLAIGFSQGAILISASAFLGQCAFDGIGLLAGFPYLVDDEFHPTKIPTVFMANGTEDKTITIDRAREARMRLAKHGVIPEYLEEPVGHKLGVQGMKALKGWVSSTLDHIEESV